MAEIINSQNIEKTKQLIKSSKPPITLQAQGYEFNRKLLEYGKFQILLNPKQLNHILAKIAAKNKISIGFDLSKLPADKKEKAQFISQLIQTIKTCRKSKTQIKLLNSKDKKDAFSFLISLGASTEQAKQAIN